MNLRQILEEKKLHMSKFFENIEHFDSGIQNKCFLLRTCKFHYVNFNIKNISFNMYLSTPYVKLNLNT